jgi:hypothetical protein
VKYELNRRVQGGVRHKGREADDHSVTYLSLSPNMPKKHTGPNSRSKRRDFGRTNKRSREPAYEEGQRPESAVDEVEGDELEGRLVCSVGHS